MNRIHVESRALGALAACLVLAAGGPLALADDHHTHPMPAVSSGYLISVRPGEQIKLTASFEAAWENCLQIYDQSSGKMLAVFNNFEPGERTWTSPKNTSDQTQLYLLVSRHKDTPPDGRQPWRLSKFGVLDKTDGSVIVGWEDGYDDDYNDTVAQVQFLK